MNYQVDSHGLSLEYLDTIDIIAKGEVMENQIVVTQILKFNSVVPKC